MKTDFEKGPALLRGAAVNALAVRLNTRRIGVITRFSDDRSIFTFDEDYLEDPDRPALSLSFKTASGAPSAPLRAYRTRTHPFFSNLLPEGRLRGYLAERAGVNPARDFFLLHALGRDLPGAVRIAPADGPGLDGADYEDSPGDEGPAAGAAEAGGDGALRFSLAGVQLKFSAIESAEGGLAVPAKGAGGDWIVKLPSLRHEAVPENEFVIMELARRIGISAPPIKLIPAADIAGLPSGAGGAPGLALAVKRFDRAPGAARVHTEDFAQVFALAPERKYEKRGCAHIARVLRAEAGPAAAEDFVRRLTFAVLTGNGDMHLKNWSLIYRDGRTPELAPAYDLLSTLPYIPEDRLALTFGGGKDIRAVTQDRIRAFADKADLPAASTWRAVRAAAEQTLEAWKSHGEKDILPDFIRNAVDRQIRSAAALTLSSA